MRYAVAFATMLGLCAPAGAWAQSFGQNQVIWERVTWNEHKTAHFDVYVSLDINDEDARKGLSDLVAHLEGSYEFLSHTLNYDLKRRPIVLVSRTHSTFEALHVSGEPFMPEGVGAFALPRGSRLLPNSELILVVKPDFLPVLNRTIYTHELVHIFQFDMVGWSFMRRAAGGDVDAWLYEATADYLANRYAPYSRDDIRRQEQRVAAANAKKPEFGGLPTLEMLQNGQANPYSLGAMPFMFLESRYGHREVDELIVKVFNDKHFGFQSLLEDLSKGEFSSNEAFDRAHRDYWGTSQHAKDSLEKHKPHQYTENFTGSMVLTSQYPYPLTSPRVSPDGTTVAFMTISNKNGIVIAVAPAPKAEVPVYVPYAERKTSWMFGTRVIGQPAPLKILTTFMPPKHYEYLIAQELNVWPFNGWDLDWWQEPGWVAKAKQADANLTAVKRELDTARATPPVHKEGGNKATEARERMENIKGLELKVAESAKALRELRKDKGVSIIAFFARKGRDHALFLLDANTGDFLRKLELPVDQAFSPAFSPDGRTVYFSAARNIRRDLYSLDLSVTDAKPVRLTAGGVFNSAPAISPDGSRIAYIAFVGGFQKLFLLDLGNGSSEQLTWGRWNDNSPSWSGDSKRLTFTCEEKDRIWNLYTLNLEDRTVSQWTDFFGGAFTPSFFPDDENRILYSAFLEDDQFRSFIYPNFEVMQLKLKKPLRTYAVADIDKTQSMELAFRTEEAVSRELDPRQLANPQKPPARWKFYGTNVQAGYSTYYGSFGYSRIMVEDLLSDRIHQGLFAQSGDFRLFDYSFTNRSRRWAWMTGASHQRYPLRYEFYSFEGRSPERLEADGTKQQQFFLNNIWAQESSALFAAAYPFDKFNRIELGIRPRKRDYLFPFTLEGISPEERAQIHPTELQAHDFFLSASGQTTVSAVAAYVHDTALYSMDTLGPLHGTLARFQVEYGLGLNGKSGSFLTSSISARKYLRLTNSILLAGRVDGMYSNRPSGELMLLGGDGSLRTYPYMSILGNQAAYVSGELRFPLADARVLGAIPVRIRGSFFGDYALARFSQDGFPTRKEWAYGGGIQAWFILPMNFEWARTRFSPKDWKFSYRVGFSF